MLLSTAVSTSKWTISGQALRQLAEKSLIERQINLVTTIADVVEGNFSVQSTIYEATDQPAGCKT